MGKLAISQTSKDVVVRTKISKVWGALFALVSMLFGTGLPAQAIGSPTTLSTAGFKTMKSTLTPAQKVSIQSFVTSNTGIATVSCVGYTGYNYLGVSVKKIAALAKTRATVACNYAASLAGATVGTVTAKVTRSQSSSIRKVVLTFTYNPPIVPGRYQYSMSNLDSGSVLHGGPVPGYFYEGDLVASTFAETNYSLDPNTGPEYGQMGTVDGGSGAYFSHWNTAADDSGTSYQLGDHLGPLPAGTTVTLYAIAATG
jgi:hypothetical protein